MWQVIWTKYLNDKAQHYFDLMQTIWQLKTILLVLNEEVDNGVKIDSTCHCN